MSTGFKWMFLCLILPGLLLKPVLSDGGVTINMNAASVTFPQYIKFQLDASSTEDIQNVTLIYGTDQLTCQSSISRNRLDFVKDKKVTLEWKLDFTRSGPIPPGVEIWWQWEITGTSGVLTKTDKKSLTVQDERFHWQSLKQGTITVQWYQGASSFGQAIMKDANRDLQRLSTQMNIKPTGKIWITVYPTTEEMRQALVTIENWAGAVAIPDSGSILMGLAPDELSYADYYLSHELAHLVVGQLTHNCMGVELPTWLNEGLAETTQGEPSKAEKDAVIQAIESQKLPPLNDIANGFSPYQDLALLEYTQSDMVTEYLLLTYGAQKISDLLAAFQSGLITDEALQKVYGMDTAGIDAAWRKSLGFSEPAATNQVTQPARTKVATLSLWTSVVRPTGTVTQTPNPTTTGTATPALSTASPNPQASNVSATPVVDAPKPSSFPFCSGSLILPAILILLFFQRRRV